jgi:hypothetical protein
MLRIADAQTTDAANVAAVFDALRFRPQSDLNRHSRTSAAQGRFYFTTTRAGSNRLTPSRWSDGWPLRIRLLTSAERAPPVSAGMAADRGTLRGV